MSTDKCYKVGIIGAGMIAETRIIPALLQIKRFKVSCIWDIDPKRTEYMSKTYSIHGALSLDELFGMNCDVVYIATPNHFHVPLAISALEKGVAVLVEKPCADKLDAAEKLLEYSKKVDRPLLVGYMHEWNRYNQTAIKLIKEKYIGEVCSYTASFGFYNTDLDGWRLLRSESGPGALADLGIYEISTALDIFGEMPVSCTAQAFPAGSPIWGDKFLCSRLNFADGRSMQIETSFLSDSCGYTVVGTEGVIHVEGSWFQSGEGDITLCRGNKLEKITADVVNPYEEELRCLLSCLDGKQVPAFMDIERAVNDVRVMEALDRSAALMGKEIKI